MRSNTYKKSICEVLEKHHLLNLSEIHEQIPEAHFASVYRNAEALCQEGIVKKIVVDRDNVKYELASNNHGHFVCDDCSVIEELSIPQSIKSAKPKTSDMLVRGLCKDCA